MIVAVFEVLLGFRWRDKHDDEIAFYRALLENESSVRELGNENLRQLAIELTQQLRKSATVDWQKRKSVRDRIRNLER